MSNFEDIINESSEKIDKAFEDEWERRKASEVKGLCKNFFILGMSTAIKILAEEDS